MNVQRKASLFRNGRSQAVRIPKEFEMTAREVTLERDGDTLIIKPLKPNLGLLAVLASLAPLAKADWPQEVEDLPPARVDF